MMADKRLIDAKALLKKTRRMYAPDEICSIEPIATACIKTDDVHRAPTIDAVPVVRCRECVCSSMCDDQLICSRIADVMDGYYRGTAEVVKPDDYCSHGIRQKAKPLDGGASDGSE